MAKSKAQVEISAINNMTTSQVDGKRERERARVNGITNRTQPNPEFIHHVNYVWYDCDDRIYYNLTMSNKHFKTSSFSNSTHFKNVSDVLPSFVADETERQRVVYIFDIDKSALICACSMHIDLFQPQMYAHQHDGNGNNDSESKQMDITVNCSFTEERPTNFRYIRFSHPIHIW